MLQKELCSATVLHVYIDIAHQQDEWQDENFSFKGLPRMHTVEEHKITE